MPNTLNAIALTFRFGRAFGTYPTSQVESPPPASPVL